MNEEVKKYMAEIGKKGGSAKTEKKAETSAENGKNGGRPPAVICKKNIIVKETVKNTSVIRGEKVTNPHVTGWWLYYEFPDGKTTEGFFQNPMYTLKQAKHLFFKTYVETHRSEYEKKAK